MPNKDLIKKPSSGDGVDSMSEDVEVIETTKPQPESTGSQDLRPKTVDTANVLKQKRIAEVVTGGKAGAQVTPDGGMTTFGVSYSGNDAKITGSLASTPAARQNARGDGRFGRKIEKVSSRLTEMSSEQVDVKIDGPIPLAQNREAVQGALGTRRNDITARTKSKGKVPASEMYQRSLDVLSRDRLVFGVGQVLKSPGNDYLDTPLKTQVKNGQGVYVEENMTIKPRGNFVPRKLKFRINANNVITDFGFEVDDISNNNEPELTLNDAAPHAKIHANKIELQRRIMDDKAGDESVSGWSPLPRMINESNAVLSYLKDIEQDTGNVAYMAHRFASLSLAYQINRTAKDGNLGGQPIDDSFNSLVNGYKDSTNLRGQVNSVVSDTESMLKGSPALMMAAFDSLTKYKNKGIVLTHPNSLKQHLFKGQNFLSTLNANPQLVKLIENTHTLSTIDGEYDGIRPVLIDENFMMTSPFDWNDQFSFTGRVAYDPNSLGNNHNPLVYGYTDHRAKYYTTSHHMLLQGIYDWLSRHAKSFKDALKNSWSANTDIEIPIVYSTTNITLWSFLVLASLSDIEKARATSLREVLYYDNNHGKAFDDLLSLDKYPTTAARGFRFNSIDDPIDIGTVPETSYFSWVWPELFSAGDEVGDNEHVTIVPWYFNEENFFNNGLSTVEVDHYRHNVSFPLVRSGIMLEGLKRMVDYDERELRLMLDRMIYPIKASVPYADFSVYKYDKASDGIPAIVFDLENNSIGDFLKVPRELGLSLVLPAGYASPDSDGNYRAVDWNRWTFDMSYRAKIYQGDITKGSVISNTTDPFDVESINVDRGSVYNQGWIYSFAENIKATNLDPGFSLSIKELFSVNAGASSASLVHGKSVFTPFTTLGTGDNQPIKSGDDYRVVTLQKAIWTRIQLLPFIINPWDNNPFAPALGENGQKYDIFDTAYWFGLAGFAASNFDEDHFNRMDKQIQEGYIFTEDLYLSDTPLLK